MSNTSESPENPRPTFTLELGGLSVRQVLRLHIALYAESEAVEAAFPNRDWQKVGNSDALPPLREYPHITDNPDSLTEAWWVGLGSLVASDLDRAKEVAVAFKDSDNVVARESAAFIAAKIAPHDYEFARDILRVLNVDPETEDAVFGALSSVEASVTPEQRADLAIHFPEEEA